MESVTHIVTPMQESENTVQSPIDAVSMSGQRRRLWVDIETVLGECHNRPSDGLVLGQRRGRLTGIEPPMGYDAGLTLNRHLVGR